MYEVCLKLIQPQLEKNIENYIQIQTFLQLHFLFATTYWILGAFLSLSVALVQQPPLSGPDMKYASEFK